MFEMSNCYNYLYRQCSLSSSVANVCIGDMKKNNYKCLSAVIYIRDLVSPYWSNKNIDIDKLFSKFPSILIDNLVYPGSSV